jgi:hypothetical protein
MKKTKSLKEEMIKLKEGSKKSNKNSEEVAHFKIKLK